MAAVTSPLLVLSIVLAILATGCGFALQVDDAPAAQPTTTLPGGPAVPGVIVPTTAPPASTATTPDGSVVPTLPGETTTTAPLDVVPNVDGTRAPWCIEAVSVLDLGRQFSEAGTRESILQVLDQTTQRFQAVEQISTGEIRAIVGRLLPVSRTVREQVEATPSVISSLDLVDAFVVANEADIAAFIEETNRVCQGFEADAGIAPLNA